MQDVKIVTLYKNKGDRSDYNNYRRISLLSTVGKAFTLVVLNRLQQCSQSLSADFERNGQQLTWQLQEKRRVQRRSLYLASMDWTKWFDQVSLTGLFTLLPKIGCPSKLLKIILSSHDGMMGTIQYDGLSSDPFPIKSGVKQGIVLAPTLSGIFFSLLLCYTYESEDGIFLHTRSDGNLFQLIVSQSKDKGASSAHQRDALCRRCYPRHALFSDSSRALRTHAESFPSPLAWWKTNIIGQHFDTTPTITTDEQILEVVDKFTYLCSTISNNLFLEAELNVRKEWLVCQRECGSREC